MNWITSLLQFELGQKDTAGNIGSLVMLDTPFLSEKQFAKNKEESETTGGYYHIASYIKKQANNLIKKMKEIDSIMLQLNERNFHSTDQVNKFFEKSLLRVAEKAQSELKKELIEWAEGRIVKTDDPMDRGYNMATRSLIRKLKK